MALCREEIVCVAGVAEIVKSVPMPRRVTVCVLPATPLLLSVTVSEPVRTPVVVGVNLILISQDLPAGTVESQVLISAKSPVMDMPEMFSGPLPTLVRVTLRCSLVVSFSW
jgi:hypothetical protein